MNCPSCRRFTPPGASRCPACGTVFVSRGAGGATEAPNTPQTPGRAAPTPGTPPTGRASAGLRSAAAAALVNYLATKTQQAVQGYLATPPAPLSPAAAAQTAEAALTPTSQVLAEGTMLSSGRYYLGPMLGRGCFGTTYRAVDQRLGRIVAIKEFFPEGSVRHGRTILPPPSLGRDGFEQERGHFMREARILAQFQRPGIVAVHEVFAEHDTAYMVMEYVAGRTLVDVLRERGGPLPPAQALRYVLACADALAAVHEKQLLHRDVKPGNIMITAKDEAVLIDFGAARSFDRHQRTSMMTAIGTPGYAPLEQWGSAGRFGPASDIYALAATLYHLLCGQMPLSAADRAVNDTLAAPHALNPDVSPALSDAVVHALAVRMDERPQTMAAFAAELRAARTPADAGGSGSGARSPAAASAPPQAAAPSGKASASSQQAAPASADQSPATAPTRAEWKQAKHDWRQARQQARQAEREQRRVTAAPAPQEARDLAAPAVAVSAAPLPQTPPRRRLPRPLPQNARELALYAVATPGAAVVLAVSLLTLVFASPLLALATITSRGTPQRISRRALRRSLQLGSRGVVLGTVCIGSLVVVACAVGCGVVFVPLYALFSSSRRRPRRPTPGLRRP